MNERIKELLLQAGVSNNWNNADWYSLSPAMVEKFTELIVQRCTELSDLAEKNCLHPGTIINRHFGVEQ